MAFHVGQKVVCVDASSRRGGLVTGIVKDAIYTVRWVGQFTWPQRGTFDCVRLEEASRDCCWSGKDVPFNFNRFRPIVERKTDISFAHEILRKHTKKRSIDA